MEILFEIQKRNYALIMQHQQGRESSGPGASEIKKKQF